MRGAHSSELMQDCDNEKKIDIVGQDKILEDESLIDQRPYIE